MKSKFFQFIESLKASMQEMQNRANEQIASLPPVEQHEAAGMITSIKAELGWLVRRAEDLAASDVVTKADEIMVTTMIYDHAARRRSYELLAEAFELRT